MKSRISICILLCLAILATGMAAAQDELVVVADKATYEAAVQAAAQAYCPPYGQVGAAASMTYGTKVKAGDSDMGLPLSAFAAIGTAGAGVTFQNTAYLSYWDIGSTPGLFDNQDVVYLQFGSVFAGPNRIVRANNIRMTGWDSYSAGSYVKPGDSDIGQQLLPWVPPAGSAFPVAAPSPSLAYMEVDGGQGYGLGDPVYIDIAGAPWVTNTNDIRLTSFAGFPAGSKLSNADPDASRPLLPIYNPPLLSTPSAGPAPTGVMAAPPITYPLGRLAFFNANGNVVAPPAPPNGVYDDGDIVYLDVFPVDIVSPNDIRLF